MFYNHYDVQPPEPLELWDSPPFAAEIRDGHLYARGVADNKGNLVARLAAVEAWLAVRGELPLNVVFVAEGEEEIGSPNLGPFAEENIPKLRPDGCIWEAGYKDTKDRLEITLGAKGILAVDLRVRTLGRDLHSANAAVFRSPAWRLIWALDSLKGPDERILIPGFYDDVRPPDDRDRALLAAWDFDEAGQLAEFGADQYVLGLSGEALKEKYLFQPTCNVCGFHTGYGGPGVKTVLPAEALAKLDFRLVPDQDPWDILEKLRAHLDVGRFLRRRDRGRRPRVPGPHRPRGSAGGGRSDRPHAAPMMTSQWSSRSRPAPARCTNSASAGGCQPPGRASVGPDPGSTRPMRVSAWTI